MDRDIADSLDPGGECLARKSARESLMRRFKVALVRDLPPLDIVTEVKGVAGAPRSVEIIVHSPLPL